MKDNEIIKTLECCLNADSLFECYECNYYGKEHCLNSMIIDALDLINRQKAEIERYEKEHNENFNKWQLLDDRTKQRYAELYEEAKAVVRAEAVKEFAEMLKEYLDDFYHTEEDGLLDTAELIDNLVKEMVGASDG